MPRLSRTAIVIRRPNGDSLRHPIEPHVDVLALLGRLAALVPPDSTWTVEPHDR